MKISNIGFFTLGTILALSQAISYAAEIQAEKPLSCTTVLLESSLDENEARRYSVKELVMDGAQPYAKIKFRRVRGHRDMVCIRSNSNEVRDGFRDDGTCHDKYATGIRMEIKSSIEGDVEKETLAYLRSKSTGALLSRLACDRPLIRRILNR